MSFLYASVVGGVSFEDSVFKADANFARIKVVGDAFSNGTVFEGPVKSIGDGMKVGQDAFFEKAAFE